MADSSPPTPKLCPLQYPDNLAFPEVPFDLVHMFTVSHIQWILELHTHTVFASPKTLKRQPEATHELWILA